MTDPQTEHDRIFGTTAASAELKRRSAVSGIITLVGRVLQVGLRLAAIAILARLLTPEDFGVRALVLPVIVLTNAVINLRLNVAALQQEELDSERLGHLFRLSMRFNLLIVLIVAAVGPLLSEIYDDPRVIGVTAAWAAAIFALNFGAFHEALLKRQLRFGTTTAIEIGSMILGLAGAIIAGSLGAGYWALVLEIGLIGIGRSVGAWLACPWRPSKATGTPDSLVTEMLRFGRNLTGVRIVSWLGNQVDRVLVGMLGGAPVLGLYDGARRWAWTPAIEMDAAFNDVAISAFSRAHERPDALRRLIRGAVAAMLVLALPVTAFVFIEAEGVVRLLFGRFWLGAVPYVELMAFAAFFAALAKPTAWIFAALGRTRRQFRWGLFQTAVILAALLIGSSRGPRGIATGFAVAHGVLAFPTIWFCLRGTSVRLGVYLGAALRPAAASVAGAVAAWGAIRILGDLGTPAQMTVKFVVLGSIYVLVWLALPGGRKAARDGWQLAREIASGAAARARGVVVEEANVTGD